MSELIDREALLDECLNHYEVGNIEQNCTMDWICKTVRNFPTASPWHRVEEPPKVSCKVIAYAVSNSTGERDVTTAYYKQRSSRKKIKSLRTSLLVTHSGSIIKDAHRVAEGGLAYVGQTL